MSDEQDHWFSRRGLEREKAADEGLFRRYREVREEFERDRSSVQALHSDNMLRGEARARIYRWLVGKSPRSILDVGCGIGLTTLGLKRVFPESDCVGIEASADAVALARQLGAGSCVFHDLIVDGDTRLDRRFDLILFQEFYPLTRTADWSVHLPFLTFALHHLEDGGDIFIQLALRHPEETILHNMDRLAAFCGEHRLILKQREIPFDRLVDWLRFPAIASPLTGPAARVFRADRRCVLQLHVAAVAAV